MENRKERGRGREEEKERESPDWHRECDGLLKTEQSEVFFETDNERKRATMYVTKRERERKSRICGQVH